MRIFLKCDCVCAVGAGFYWFGDIVSVYRHTTRQHAACWVCNLPWASCE